MAFIDAHRGRFGVESICHTLQVAPSTYYGTVGRPPSQRSIDDSVLSDEILRVWKENYEVYGVRKVWRQLNREGIPVGRDRVERLMKALDIAGVRRGKRRRTTIPDAAAERPDDLVQRSFWADRPNRLWIADLTYEEFDIKPSVGSRGDSYDNALAESTIGLYKAELIAGRSWGTPAQVERETAAYVHWYNHRRLHGACHDTPSAEFEAAYYRNRDTSASAETQ